MHPLQLLGDKHSSCCLTAVPSQLHCVVPRPSETKHANQMDIRNLNLTRVQEEIFLNALHTCKVWPEKPRENPRIPKNSTNSARVALAFIQRKEQRFQVDYDFKKAANPRRFPSFPVSHRWHLFQGRLCDLRCSLAVPGNQGIRHRRGDRTKDPYIQGLKKHHVSVIKKMGENLGSDFFLNLWLLNTCKYNSLLSLNIYIYVHIYIYISQNII